MVRFEANQGDSRQKVISAGSQRVLRDTTTFRCEFTHLIYTQKRKEGKTIYVDVTGGTLSVTYVQFRGTQKLIDSRDVFPLQYNVGEFCIRVSAMRERCFKTAQMNRKRRSLRKASVENFLRVITIRSSSHNLRVN